MEQVALWTGLNCLWWYSVSTEEKALKKDDLYWNTNHWLNRTEKWYWNLNPRPKYQSNQDNNRIVLNLKPHIGINRTMLPKPVRKDRKIWNFIALLPPYNYHVRPLTSLKTNICIMQPTSCRNRHNRFLMPVFVARTNLNPQENVSFHIITSRFRW